jgi:hypothetical protein
VTVALAFGFVALAAAVVALWLAARWRTWRGSRRARVRAARAGRGEDLAAELLADAGYAIIARQARLVWAVVVDGEPFDVELRADYLVTCAGETLVAEVKTGDAAPRLDTAATRRQLLEYRVAFGADAVLLVCPERGAIHRVDFVLGGLARGAAKNLPGATPAATLDA